MMIMKYLKKFVYEYFRKQGSVNKFIKNTIK